MYKLFINEFVVMENESLKDHSKNNQKLVQMVLFESQLAGNSEVLAKIAKHPSGSG